MAEGLRSVYGRWPTITGRSATSRQWTPQAAGSLKTAGSLDWPGLAGNQGNWKQLPVFGMTEWSAFATRTQTWWAAAGFSETL